MAVRGSASLADEIRHRADIVQRLGQWIGFFEFACWCWLRCRNIRLCMGTHWLSIDEYFPMLQERTRGPNSGEPVHVAAAVWNASQKQWSAVHEAYKHALQHYVIAVPVREPISDSIVESLDLQLQQLGFIMIPTAAQGDCGIDALVFHENNLVYASPAQWKHLRLELSSHMRAQAEEPAWQALFRACCEARDDNPGVRQRKPERNPVTGAGGNDRAGDDAPSDEESSDSESCSSMPTLEDSCDSDSDSASDSGSDSDAEPENREHRTLQLGAKAPPELPKARGKADEERKPAEDVGSEVVPAVAVEERHSSSSSARSSSDMVAAAEERDEEQKPASALLARPVDLQAKDAAEDCCSKRGCARGYRNPQTLRAHMATLSETELRRIAGSLEAFLAYESEFYAKRAPGPRRRADVTRRSTLVHQRLALGRAYQKWLETPAGRVAVQERRQRKAFLAAGTERSEGSVTKAETQRLVRAWQFALQQDLEEGLVDEATNPEVCAQARKFQEQTARKRKRRGEDEETAALQGVMPGASANRARIGKAPPLHLRRRLLRFQGRKHKCPALREQLYDWFVDMRTVFTKISPGTIKKQAWRLSKSVWKHGRERGEWPMLPRITYEWVRGWRREYRVSLRRPNCKYKLSRAAMLERLKHVWRANLSIRWLAWYCLGVALVVWGCDQKPLYMNEGGHKGMQTCEFEGAELAVIKECITQTRQRVSLFTTVTSDAAEASAELPIAMCFKGKSQRTLKHLPKNLGNKIYQFAPKGSYRVEQVVEFLEKALPEWTAERAAAKDWRILYLDAYSAHFADDVVLTAWRHGFVLLWHGAGCTGILQVNDTHLHAGLERIYLEMEAESFAHQLYFDPTDISRSRLDVAFDVAGTWAALDHRGASQGHLSNGLCNRLGGEDDPAMSRDVEDAWVAVGGPQMRLDIGEEIREKVASGEYAWDWATIQKLSGRTSAERILGAYKQEGRELEAAQAEGEAAWEDEPDNETEAEKEDSRQVRVEQRRAEASAATGLAAHDLGGVVVPALEADTEAAKQVAQAFADKRKAMLELKEKAQGADLAPLRWSIDRKLRAMTKSACPQGGARVEGDDLVRRYLAAEAAVQSEARARAMESARKRKKKLAKLKVKAKKQKLEAAAQKIVKDKEKAERKAAEEAAQAAALAARHSPDRKFEVNEFQPKGKRGQAKASKLARRDFLEVLRNRHGVSDEVQAYWGEFVEWYADWVVDGKPKGASELKEVEAKMRKSADRAKEVGKASQAFSKWVAEKWALNVKKHG